MNLGDSDVETIATAYFRASGVTQGAHCAWSGRFVFASRGPYVSVSILSSPQPVGSRASAVPLPAVLLVTSGRRTFYSGTTAYPDLHHWSCLCQVKMAPKRL